MTPRHRPHRRRRRAIAPLAIGILALGLVPAACNVFITLPAPPGEGDSGTSKPPADADVLDAAAEAAVDADADADADAAPLPPPCDIDAAFQAPIPVLGLDPTLTSARFSDDELLVMYSANPPGCSAESCADLFYARRDSLDASFQLGNPLPGQDISVPNASEYWPTTTKDGLILYFESSRALTKLSDGGFWEDQSRIWTATRTNKIDFGEPVLLQAFRDVPGPDSNPYIHPSGRSLYFVSAGRGGAGALDLFVAVFDPDFGVEPKTITPIAAANTVADESAPVVTLDERTLFFARDSTGIRKIWRSARSDPAAAWGSPALVPTLNSTVAGVDDFPSAVSLDECRLYLVSNRPLASDTGDAATQPGSYRLWVASRPK